MDEIDKIGGEDDSETEKKKKKKEKKKKKKEMKEKASVGNRVRGCPPRSPSSLI